MNRLDAIRQREQAATEGPWVATLADDEWESPLIRGGDERYIAQTAYDAMPSTVRPTMNADAAFIAHARTDIPALLAVAEAAREVMESHRAGFWSPVEFGALEAALAPLLEPEG